eukprot:1830825-Pleurochrysis_carterae.AAC.4
MVSRNFAKNAPGVSFARTLSRTQINSQPAIYTDKAKPLKAPRILRTEKELRQRGARRQDRDISMQIASSGKTAISSVAENVAIGSQGRR